ncbi:tRNA uridine-5-carboxymethylaminomethyl(34) synthesis GTPase MnmE [Candidatus Tachikawaea gelatinosa]|uniref:tRNA modification GTPase MnmE n=1 Tax=Candidatus Tachikawaea gelatinosa TaxID=1410383 RepID=A0A090AR80_9ENTR|nr:tRNA uridine-5-carboxymethylaminomethyl(34) synthesis GTPase MnmE [Candidatus Tachikawaea gelatinosa]BAP58275.1 tRNA modification GTPase MnmE [Candidatus Tachikawaea gelatinosa]
MNNEKNDTIAAISTNIGRSGIGIIRVSGALSSYVAQKILGNIPKARYAHYSSFKNIKGIVIDKGIAIWFKKPNSFTGEDLLELQGHGSPLALKILLKEIISIPNIRIAQPGEFSKRAFLNNKLDLTQAESIIDFINASSIQEIRAAVNSLQGFFSNFLKEIIHLIKKLRINLESIINFPEEDISHLSDQNIHNQINSIHKKLINLYKKASENHLTTANTKIVIAGFPNAGKSSLFNTLLKYEAAIVSKISGTTRDVLRENIYIDEKQVSIVDTAGLNFLSKNEIEKIGIKKACNEIKTADHIFFVIDAYTTKPNYQIEKICPEFSVIFNKVPITIIHNKIDLTQEKEEIIKINNRYVIRLSTYTGKGIKILYQYLKKNILFKNTNCNFFVRERHLNLLKKASNEIIKAKNNSQYNYYELIAEDLRLSENLLNEIIGKHISRDEILTDIFNSFCIGK